MAVAQLIFSAPTSAHPLANPGYGKRSAPAQNPSGDDDFAGLTPLARALGAYIDQLPDGAAMGIKALASQLPHGQAAISTALNCLSQGGYLRRVQELLDGGTRWVTRTYFSRTARVDAWWKAWLGGLDMNSWQEEPVVKVQQRKKDQEQEPSRAYVLLATLHLADRRLALSAKDCERLAPLVERWFERGADEDRIRAEMTALLPPEVKIPGMFVARRLTDKLPPAPRAESARPAVRRMMLCTQCENPGEPDALPGGLCAECREAPVAMDAGLAEANVRALAAEVRKGMRA
ncbi:hypothetical protein [Streptomyces sp. NBC_01465]|uniref:hypothetical protein n=1 Tax=Streptomyces sp. NBC_01465 TaxID=2903878 RepID=UPI002E3677E7|nr:hypothetical protein [Streptomyces sp. NBC_01465]